MAANSQMEQRSAPNFNKLSLSEQVEDALRREITEGRVRPGQRVNVADYQDNWNISSTPFRDAVKALETQGFVYVEPRKGVFVATMDAETIDEIFDLRIALECMAVERATMQIPQHLVEDALERYANMKSLITTGPLDELGETDRLVHDLAREHCGNRRLQRLLVGQLDLVRWVQNTIIQRMPTSYEAALPEHLAIMEAIQARNVAAATRAMRQHLERSRMRLASQISA